LARILYAEDHPDIAFMLQFRLEDAGHEVVLAPDGVAALEAYEATPFEVALVDVMMPRMDGFELCRRLKAQDPAPVVILITARDRSEDRAAGLAAGADDYVVKPVSPQALLERIDELLGA